VGDAGDVGALSRAEGFKFLESMKKRVAIVVDSFERGSAAQQIIDRLSIGYTRDGLFQARPVEEVAIIAPPENKSWTQAARESRVKAIAAVDAVVVFAADALAEVIENVGAGTPVFVYGAIAKTEKEAKAVLRKAAGRKVPISSGTVMATLLQLPQMEIPRTKGIGAQIREALIVTHRSELEAFDAVASILEQHGGVGEIKKVRTLEGDAVWEAADKDWSWRLLAAALSRTDNAQGNTALDGRTEEILNSGLIKSMAKNPRARIIEHSGGLRTVIMVLDGVVTDLLMSVRAGRRLMPGSIYSTQLFQSPKPQQEEYSRLVTTIIEFFETGTPPWSANRTLAMAELSEKLGK
jgi:hypothetical protein